MYLRAHEDVTVLSKVFRSAPGTEAERRPIPNFKSQKYLDQYRYRVQVQVQLVILETVATLPSPPPFEGLYFQHPALQPIR